MGKFLGKLEERGYAGFINVSNDDGISYFVELIIKIELRVIYEQTGYRLPEVFAYVCIESVLQTAVSDVKSLSERLKCLTQLVPCLGKCTVYS